MQLNLSMRIALIWLFVLCQSSPLYAGWLAKQERVKTILSDAALTLDGVLVLDFAWRGDLGFDAKKLNLIATYKATQPKASGVKIIKEKICTPNPRLPFGGSCSKYEDALEYAMVIPSDWISFAGNTVTVKLAERIKGAGEYQIVGLRFDCPKTLCNEYKFKHTGLYDSDFMLVFTQRSKEDKQQTLMLANSLNNSFTAQFTGLTLGLQRSQGFYGEENHSDLSGYNDSQNGGFYAQLQDKTGKWHTSELAFKNRYEASCPSVHNAPVLDLAKYASMGWTRVFTATAHGELYDTFVYDKNNNRVNIAPGNWTGCVEFKASNPKNSEDGEETRHYFFENGKLYKRRIDRNVRGVYSSEVLYLDSQLHLSTYRRTEYSDKTQKENKLVWSQIEKLAYPQTKPAPNVDLNSLRQEAADVLTIITPQFNAK